jgi:hypothetical protein
MTSNRLRGGERHLQYGRKTAARDFLTTTRTFKARKSSSFATGVNLSSSRRSRLVIAFIAYLLFLGLLPRVIEFEQHCIRHHLLSRDEVDSQY